MLPELTGCILEKWTDLCPGANRPDGIHYLGIGGSVEGGTVAFLGFGSGMGKPLFVVKVYRGRDTDERALKERDILTYLQVSGGELAAFVPHLILCKKIAGTWMLVQSVMKGRPIISTMTKDGVPDIQDAAVNISVAANWLLQLHEMTHDTSTTATDLLKHKSLNTIQELSETFDLSPQERGYIRIVLGELDTVAVTGAVVQHGDFSRQNILISKNGEDIEVRVIDWTDSKRIGFPLYDLFFFVTTYYLQVRRDSGLEGFIGAFENIFFDTTPYSNIVKQQLIEFCERIHLGLSKAKTLFALFLIERAVFEYQQVKQCAKSGGLPRFTLYLSGVDNLDYPRAMKAQFWIHFFKTFVARQRDFIV